MKNYMAPMEGVTNWVYRNAYHECFYPMDKYFTPLLPPSQTRDSAARKLKKCPLTQTESFRWFPRS